MAFTGISTLVAPNGNRSLLKPLPPLGSNWTNGKLAHASHVPFAVDRIVSGFNSSRISAISCDTTVVNQIMHTSFLKGSSLSSFSTATSAFSVEYLGGPFGAASMPYQGCRGIIHPRAHRYSPFGFRYPEITEKPVWWWRTLACIPYLVALQLSEAGHYLCPILKHYKFFENLVFYIPGALNRWPGWFSRWYHFAMYLMIVKNKRIPHFFRFHLMMGILMEIALKLVVRISNFMPLIHYRGTFKVPYWGVIGVIYMVVLMECVRYALVGRYAEIPFLEESAYIHTLFGTYIKIGDIFK